MQLPTPANHKIWLEYAEGSFSINLPIWCIEKENEFIKLKMS